MTLHRPRSLCRYAAPLGLLTLSTLASVASAQPAPATSRAAPPSGSQPLNGPPSLVCGAAGMPGPKGSYTILPYRCAGETRALRGLDLPPGSASWEAAVVGGLGSFVADRAQQEVIQWFVDTMLRDLCKTADGQRLFERTCRLHAAVEGATLPSRSAIVAALRADVERLPSRLLEKVDPVDGKAWGAVVLHLLQGIRRAAPPMELMAGIAELPELKESPPCAATPMRASCALVAASVAVQAYIEAGSFQAPEPEYLQRFIESLTKKATDLKLPQIEVAKATILFGQIRQLSDAIRDFQSSITIALVTPTEFAQKRVLAIAFDLVNTITSAIPILAEPLGVTVLMNDTFKTFQLATSALASSVAGRYEEALAPTAELVALIAQAHEEFPPAIKRYLPLAMDLARAKSDAEVKTALEAAAEPVGGWRLKRTGFVASLGALAGVSAGWELSLGKDRKMRESGFVANVFAPVGFDFSWPLGKTSESTVSVFISVLDLGNVVGARFGGSEASDVKSVDTAPVLGFAQVFSLGPYLRFGLGKSPFVLAAGAAWSPQFRRLTLLDGTTSDVSAVRFHLGLGADLTLFPF